jgi:hypothetical protein
MVSYIRKFGDARDASNDVKIYAAGGNTKDRRLYLCARHFQYSVTSTVGSLSLARYISHGSASRLGVVSDRYST